MMTRSHVWMIGSAAFAAFVMGCSSPAPAPSSSNSSSDYADCGYDYCDSSGGTTSSTGSGGTTNNSGSTSSGGATGGSCGNACNSNADCAAGSFCRPNPTTGQSACVPDSCNTCFGSGQICSYYANPCSFAYCGETPPASGGAGGSGGGGGAGGAGGGGAGSGAGGGSGSGGSTTCHSMTNCVGATGSTSNSACNNEYLATLVNNCGQDVYCRITTNTGDKSGGSLAAGETQSGESAGYWWCDGSSHFTYQCIAAADPITCLQ